MTTGREKLVQAVVRAVTRHWSAGSVTLRGTLATGVAGPGAGVSTGGLVLNPGLPLFVGWGPAAPGARAALLAGLGGLVLRGTMSGPGVGAFVAGAAGAAPLGPFLSAELPNGADKARLLAELTPWITTQILTYSGTGATAGAGYVPVSGVVLAGTSTP